MADEETVISIVVSAGRMHGMVVSGESRYVSPTKRRLMS